METIIFQALETLSAALAESKASRSEIEKLDKSLAYLKHTDALRIAKHLGKHLVANGKTVLKPLLTKCVQDWKHQNLQSFGEDIGKMVAVIVEDDDSKVGDEREADGDAQNEGDDVRKMRAEFATHRAALGSKRSKSAINHHNPELRMHLLDTKRN